MSINSKHNKPWLVFSDLDGTLLDGQSYSFATAIPALQHLAENRVPVVLCTSKTSTEVALICKQMKLEHPFIVENGSAVYIPKNYFHQLSNEWNSNGDCHVRVLGKTYSEILSFFEKLKNYFNIPARGFQDMNENELLELTGLKREEIVSAQNREYSEPFILTESFRFGQEIFEYVQKQEFRLLKGNRFYHLLGDTDKGKAVNFVRVLFERNSSQTYQTVGIGDSPNDQEMLQAVDQPVLVKKQNGRYAELDQIQDLFRTEGVGPIGWQEAIYKFLPTEQIK